MAESRRLQQLRRLRTRLFPRAEALTFDNTRQGFAPLPVIFRVLVRAFRQDTQALRRGDFLVLMALYSFRDGPMNMVDADLDELAYGVGLSSRHKLIEPMERLKEVGLILEAKDGLKTWILLCDPVHAVPEMVRRGLLSIDDVSKVNDVLSSNGRSEIEIAA